MNVDIDATLALHFDTPSTHHVPPRTTALNKGGAAALARILV
jgi:hypothetical protein